MDTFTIIGLIAAACTTVAFLPQVIQVMRTKHTKDLSLAMYLILTIGISLWLVYGLMISDTPLIVANAITLIFASIILAMKFKYK